MRSLPCFHYHFTPRWQMTMLTFVALALFCRLGFWQLNRATEKEQIIQARIESSKAAPLLWKTGMALPKPFQQLRLEGHFLSDNFLLDNQIHQHQVGYHVLTPLRLDTDHYILINRGWIPAGITRQDIPPLTQPKELLSLSGEVYYPSNKTWVLGQEIEQQGPFTVLERVSFSHIEALLKHPLYPFLIRLNEQKTYGYVPTGADLSLTPQRHYGYALQWFLMGMVCLILFVVLNLEKK